MLKVKSNFKEHFFKIEAKEKALLCPLCKKYDDSQQHIIECEKIDKNSETVTQKEYQSLLSEKIDTDILVRYKKLWEQREDLLDS